jgi:hypothetical protein
MTPSNEEIWSERGSKWGDRFTRHPILWGGGTIIVAIVVIFLVGSVLGFFGSWFNAGRDIVSPDNVSKQYKAVIGDYKGMEAAASNACAAKKAAQTESSPLFLEDPEFAYAAQYRRIEVDYNTRQNNLFEAEQVGPKGYPSTAPTLEEMQAKVC